MGREVGVIKVVFFVSNRSKLGELPNRRELCSKVALPLLYFPSKYFLRCLVERGKVQVYVMQKRNLKSFHYL